LSTPKGWRLDNAELTEKIVELEQRILNLEERVSKIEKTRRRGS
jgi:hypothetical protein